MRKHPKKTRKPAKKFRRLSLTTVIVTAAILAVGAVAIGAVVGSRQKADAVKASSNLERRAPVANKAGKNFVTVKVAGQDVQVDGQTGQVKQLTPEEAQKIAAGLKQSVNRSTEGLVEVQHADGSVTVDLEGRFQNVTMAKIDEDGNLVQACVDSPRAAAAFLGIDPKLVEDETASPRKPAKTEPEKN